MSRRELLRWGGGSALLVAAAGGWVLWRDAVIGQVRSAAAEGRAALAQTWVPDRPEEGERYAADLAARRRQQEEALAVAESRLVPELAPEYRTGDLLAAQARLRTDILALRVMAERSRIPLPTLLPLEDGLDQDAARRALQLASLRAVRLAVGLCLEGGVARVAACRLGSAYADPSGTYAAIPLELEVEGPAAALQALILAFRDAHRQGLGLRQVELEPLTRPESDPAAIPQRLRLEAALLVRAQPEWRVPAGPPAGAPRAAGLRRGEGR